MIRYIHHWNIIKIEDQNQKWFAVTGFVREISNDKPLIPETNTKYTTSSPIIKIEGRNVYTESGSHYVLEGESLEFMESPEKYKSCSSNNTIRNSYSSRCILKKDWFTFYLELLFFHIPDAINLSKGYEFE